MRLSFETRLKMAGTGYETDIAAWTKEQARLLKWQYQPERRGASWEITVRYQRRAIQLHLKQVPSLIAKLDDADWWEIVWGDAVAQAAKETGLGDFPETCPWTVAEIPDPNFLPC